jgi:phosphohistidine phosphatase SixA
MRATRILTATVLAWGLLGAGRPAAAADQVIFLVRHAERADAAGGQPPAGMTANDPPLSAAGHDRAKKLAALLASAEVKHIFTTEFVRTQQTAAPFAAAAQIKPVAAPARNVDPLVQQVRQASGNVLLVGHTNTVPELLKRLGVAVSVSIAETEYDNLFIVVRPAGGEPTLIRLRY